MLKHCSNYSEFKKCGKAFMKFPGDFSYFFMPSNTRISIIDQDAIVGETYKPHVILFAKNLHSEK